MATGAAIVAKPGPHQWHVLHLERGDEPRLLASDAHQASHSCQGPAVYPCGQYGHVYRCGADPPPLSRLLPHGGRLRTCHHHHDADDHLAPRLLPAPKGRVAHPLHGLCRQLLCHRGHLPWPPTSPSFLPEDGVRCSSRAFFSA